MAATASPLRLLLYSAVTFALLAVPSFFTSWIALAAGLTGAVITWRGLARQQDAARLLAVAFHSWAVACKVFPYVAIPSFLLALLRNTLAEEFSHPVVTLFVVIGIALISGLVVGSSWALGGIFRTLEEASLRGVAENDRRVMAEGSGARRV